GVIEGENRVRLTDFLFPHQFGEEDFLAVEIDVERALRDAGGAGYVAHAGGIEALRQEQLAGAIEDLLSLARVLTGAGTLQYLYVHYAHSVLHASPFTATHSGQ